MSVLHELKRYVEDHNQKVVTTDTEILNEGKVQMAFLKKSVDALHNKLTREQAEHARNRIEVMEINQKLIHEIQGEGKLKETIEKLKKQFNDAGGSKKFNEIVKKNNERDKMLDYIEQEEKGGKISSTRSLNPAQDQAIQQDARSSDIDPRITHEIQQKKLYVEKLRAELKRLKEENEAIQQQHYGI